MKRKTRKKNDDKQASRKASLDEWLDREIESSQKAFKNENVGALKDVVYFCGKYQKPLPQWTTSELLILIEDHIRGTGQKKKGRNARWITQYRQDMKDFIRADCVQECIEHGIKWDDVYGVAYELLKGTFAKGTESAIEKGYKRYKQRSKKEPYRYRILHTIRTQDINLYSPSSEIWKYIHSLRKKTG